MDSDLYLIYFVMYIEMSVGRIDKITWIVGGINIIFAVSKL